MSPLAPLLLFLKTLYKVLIFQLSINEIKTFSVFKPYKAYSLCIVLPFSYFYLFCSLFQLLLQSWNGSLPGVCLQLKSGSLFLLICSLSSSLHFPIFKPLSAFPLEPKTILITPPPDLWMLPWCSHRIFDSGSHAWCLVSHLHCLELLWTSCEDVHRHMHPSGQDTQRNSPMSIATAKWSWAYAHLAHFWFQNNIIECACFQHCAWMQERPTDWPTHSLTNWLTDRI